MAEDRTPRADDARDYERPQDSWKPSSVLPTPEPRDGWRFRWVRTSYIGRQDNTNVSQRFREGWVPVTADEVKELSIMSDIDSRFDNNIEVGGLLLCKAPVETVEARQRYYGKVNQSQIEAVDNNLMKENDPRMPMLRPERSTRETFGRG